MYLPRDLAGKFTRPCIMSLKKAALPRLSALPYALSGWVGHRRHGFINAHCNPPQPGLL